MNDWSILISVIITVGWGLVAYRKGFNDGRDRQDEDIERIIVKALKKYKEG